jgi:hypothetical protein
MKITKTQLRKIIKEELNEVTVTHSDREDWTKRRPDESGRDFMRRMSYEKSMRANTNIPGKEATLDFLRDELGSWQPEALERLRSVLETERFDLTQEVLDIIAGI